MDKYLQSIIESTNGPMTRWWWYGCNVEKGEIKRELEMMHESYITGVEIQICYPTDPDCKEKDYHNIPYFSPEFFDIMSYTCETASKLGMKVDFTMGSSWPFGGPFVDEDNAAPMVVPYVIDVNGPQKFKYDFTTRIVGKIVSVTMGKIVDNKIDKDTVIDITDKVVDKYLFGWKWGFELDEIDIPEGPYKIVVFVANRYTQHVLKPSRDAEGAVIDHNKKESMDLFLRNMCTPLVEKIGKGKINAFFCDSIETDGHNWTYIIFDEFLQRRGYDLRPYVFALWGEISDITSQIRYDFHKTMSELTIENFFENMTNWCHEMGSVSRIQAHGTWGDILKVYGTADIPEGETFSQYDKYEVNTIHRKIASSAGHLYNKKIISNESFTWLRFPRFTVTLEQIKVAADSIFLDGINQIVNHGYSYSPPQKEALDAAFYASCHICHTNPWWKYYKKIGKYVGNISTFLQKGYNFSDVLVYLPQADIWAENPLSDVHMSMKLAERFDQKLINAIHKDGYWFDYINDEVLLKSEINGTDGIKINENAYKVMFLINTERIELEVAEKIYQFVKKGGTLICFNNIPDKACSYVNYEEDTAKINEIFQKMFTTNTTGFAMSSTGDGKTAFIKDDVEKAIKTLNNLHKHIFKVDNMNKEYVGYVHRIDGDKHIYFLSNMSKEYRNATMYFENTSKKFKIYSPFDEKEVFPSEVTTDNGLNISYNFKPNESVIVIFDNAFEENNTLTAIKKYEKSVDISKGFTLTLPEENFTKKYDVLNGWEKEEKMQYFSGTADYTNEFEASEIGKKHVLCIESLHEVCEVYINDKFVDNIIMKPFDLDITDFVVAGKNTITLKVTNLLINRALKRRTDNNNFDVTILEQWPYFNEHFRVVRKDRLFDMKEWDLVKEPFKSGLVGKVSINIG